MRTASATRVTAIAALALFSFVFLGTEFCFDTRIGAFVSSANVVWAQNIGLGISAAGFIAFGLIAHRANRRCIHLRTLTMTSAFITCACLLGIEQATSESAIRAAGYAAFFLLGGAGATAHWLVAHTLAGSVSLARTVGIAYACGILLQFLNNQFIPAGLAETMVLCLGCITLAASMLNMETPKTTNGARTSSPTPVAHQTTSKQQVRMSETRQSSLSSTAHAASEPAAAPSLIATATQNSHPQPLKTALWATVLVMLLACMFSTLDNVVTIANAQGTINIEQWPRLFLAISGIITGFLFDIDQRRYMGLVMFCVALLSTCSILATEAGINPLVGLITFYLGSGCFVVFFTTTFLALAPTMKTPALWAGMGRAANNICALVLSGASLALVQTDSAILTMFATVILFALISVAMVASGLLILPNSIHNEERIITPRTTKEATQEQNGTPISSIQRKNAQPKTENSQGKRKSQHHASATREPQESPAISSASTPESHAEKYANKQHLSAFAEQYGLTPRETDVLQAVSTDDRPLKQVADDLGISLRMVQRHLTSLYQKTNTQSRTGLAMKYLGKQ